MPPNPRLSSIDIMITRRVHNRAYRLRPSKKTNAIVEYVLAVLIRHHALELHAFMVMSNHWHLRFFDRHGSASDFARDAHSMVARLILWTFGDDDESLWSPVPSHYSEDDEPEGPIQQIAYVMTDPVRSGLVKHAKSWPGASGRWPQRDRVLHQPKGFFQEDRWTPKARTESGRPKIHWSKTATLTFTRPRGCEDINDAEMAVALSEAIAAREEMARQKWKDVPGAFPGRRAALRVSRYERSRDTEAKRGSKRTPSIKCNDRERRIERLSGIREWRLNYRACLKEWPSNRDVIFPYGTNKMRVLHGVKVDEAPT